MPERDVGAAYAQALRIWVGRFKEAQRVIRELERENEALREALRAVDDQPQ